MVKLPGICSAKPLLKTTTSWTKPLLKTTTASRQIHHIITANSPQLQVEFNHLEFTRTCGEPHLNQNHHIYFPQCRPRPNTRRYFSLTLFRHRWASLMVFDSNSSCCFILLSFMFIICNLIEEQCTVWFCWHWLRVWDCKSVEVFCYGDN